MTEDKKKLAMVDEILSLDLAPEVVQAVVSLKTGKLPPEMISNHPGKGGRIFSYVKHTHATMTMNNSGLLWDYDADVGNATLFEDRSAAVPCKLTVRLVLNDGSTIERHVTEVGAFEDGTGVMPKAMILASAASRGLPRCMMRMFGWGIELYPESATPPVGWWKALRGYAASKKIASKDLRAELKKRGFEEEDLELRYEEAVEIINEMSKEKPEKFNDDNGEEQGD